MPDIKKIIAKLVRKFLLSINALVFGVPVLLCALGLFWSPIYRAYTYLREGYNPTLTLETWLKAKPLETDWVGISKIHSWFIGQPLELVFLIVGAAFGGIAVWIMDMDDRRHG